MKYGTATIKPNVCFFLYGIVLCLYIDSKNSLILQEKVFENGKLRKLEPRKKWKLHFRIKTTRASRKVLLKSNDK